MLAHLALAETAVEEALCKAEGVGQYGVFDDNNVQAIRQANNGETARGDDAETAYRTSMDADFKQRSILEFSAIGHIFSKCSIIAHIFAKLRLLKRSRSDLIPPATANHDVQCATLGRL